MNSTSRLGPKIEVTREMLDAGCSVLAETPPERIIELYRVMRPLEPGAMPEPIVAVGRNPYAHGGR